MWTFFKDAAIVILNREDCTDISQKDLKYAIFLNDDFAKNNSIKKARSNQNESVDQMLFNTSFFIFECIKNEHKTTVRLGVKKNFVLHCK